MNTKQNNRILFSIGISVIIACIILLIPKNNKNAVIPSEETTSGATTVVQTERYDKAEEILSAMTLREKVYQMMFVTPESITGVGQVTMAGDGTKTALENHPVGGVIYFAPNIQSPEQITLMIENTQSYSEIPLFIGVDEEGGRVARIANNPDMGTTKFHAMKNVQSVEEAYEIGQILGTDLSGLGFNVDFAPVADVIISGQNSEIGDRSFGTDAVWVSDCVAKVVEGLEQNGVSSVLKHFPGHGSTTVDSHTGYSASYRTIDEIRSCEFLPFKKGIEAGSDFVMVSHMTLVNVTEDKLPASLSEEIIKYLKEELGFGGIVITDSLSMGAITKEYSVFEAAVLAVNAGCDMLLMPQDVSAAADAVIKAVESGVIDEMRIDESVRKILRIKIDKGLL